MEKRQSQVHEMSDSDSDQCETSKILSNPKASNNPKEKTIHENLKKKTFMNEFLNMSSDDEDKCIKLKKTNTDSASDCSEELRVAENKKKIDALKKLKKKQESGKSDNSNIGSEKKHHFSEKAHKKNYSMPFDQSVRSVRSESKQEKLDCVKEKKSKPEKNPEKNKPRGVSTGNTSCSSKDSPSSLKRKHTRSPVPQELRKAVTEIMTNIKSSEFVNSKKPCQYGLKCYRKKPSHFAEYSHPGGKKSYATEIQ